MKIIITAFLIYACLGMSLAEPQKYQGKAITPEIQLNILDILKKAFILNGHDTQKNRDFIKMNLQNTYKGYWNVFITTTDYYYGDYGYLNCSMSNQWWIKWYGMNPYLSSWVYGMERYQQPKYQPSNTYVGSISGTQFFGKGIADQKKQIIRNLVQANYNANQSLKQLQDYLNQYVERGNWNIIYQRYTGLPFFTFYALENKVFAYTYGDHYVGFLS